MTNQIAVCIAGWHFKEGLFRLLSSIPNGDVFVVSHKDQGQIPDYVFSLIGSERILIRPNRGYDWGCYQQFLESGLWKDYALIFFLHDDIEIHDPGFIQAALALLGEHAVIGNGIGEGTVSRTGVTKHPYAYAHSSWKPASPGFEHKTVRGSFFATTREVLEAVGKFEVYWDPWKLNIEFGNWSTKASCGKLEALYGGSCFGYLSQTFGSSQYITELYRGEVGEQGLSPSSWKRALYQFIKRVSVVYMQIYYRERKVPLRPLWLLAGRLFLSLFSGRL